MSPTLTKGETVEIEAVPYSESLDRFSVVLFWHPRQSQELWIGRLAGLPGDTVDYDAEGRMLINGESVTTYSPPQSLRFYKAPDKSYYFQKVNHPVVLGSKQYYVVADNWKEGIDSEHYGPVPRKNILGVASSVK